MRFKRETIGSIVESITNGVNCKQNKEGVGIKISRIETIAHSKINYQKTGFCELNEIDKKKYKLIKGDILFSHINSPIHVGKTALYDGEEDLYHGVNLLKIKVKKHISPYYFKYFLEEIFKSGYWKKTSKQSVNQASVNQADIKKIEFLYPSLEEQQHIVAKLDAAFAEIDKTNLINTKINKYLNEISDKLINLKFDSIVEKKTLGSLCDFLNGYAFKSKETVDTSNVQLLRMGNLYNNKLDLGRRSVFYPESYANDYNKYIINPGDIVMTLTGTVGKRDYGYAIEIYETKLKLLLNQRILKLHNFKSNSINKKYLLFYLNSKSFLNVLFKTANGTRQANLSSETIKTLKIPVTSMDNQIEILKKLKLLDESKKILLENLKTESKLLQSLKFSLIKNLIKDKAA